MGLMTMLTRVDQRVVPRLARGAGRIVDVGRAHRPRPLTVAAVVLLLTVGATAAWRYTRPPAAGSEGTSPVRVGVRDGDSVPAYVDASRAELAALVSQSPDRAIYALVSFIRYLTPEQVASVASSLPAGGLGTVVGYGRVPLPRRQTQFVVLPANRLPDDLIAEMTAIASRKAGDAASFERLAASEQNESLKAIWVSNAEVSTAEASAYRALCACVFALVVRGTPVVLSQLSHHVDVRVVDAAPEIANTGDAVFTAPLPEQVDVVAPPADDARLTSTP